MISIREQMNLVLRILTNEGPMHSKDLVRRYWDLADRTIPHELPLCELFAYMSSEKMHPLERLYSKDGFRMVYEDTMTEEEIDRRIKEIEKEAEEKIRMLNELKDRKMRLKLERERFKK